MTTRSAPTAPAAAPWGRLQLTRLPELQWQGQRLPLAPVDSLLLAWLALRGPTPRSRLAELVWPESEPAAARAVLRQRLYKLRLASGADLVVGRQTVALAPGLGHDLSAQGPLLEGVDTPAQGELRDWLVAEQEGRRRHARHAMLQALQQAEAAGQIEQALLTAQQWYAAQPQDEQAQLALIRLHYLAGDRAAARRACQRVLQWRADELGTGASPELLALQRLIDDPQALTVAPAAPLLPAGVLRPPRLVGRSAETAAVHAAWARGQVVALVAEAGMGKTRLLQQLLPAGPAVDSPGAVSGLDGAATPRRAVMVAARPGDAGVPLATLARWLRAVAAQGGSAPPEPARHALARVVPEWASAEVPVAEGQRLALQRALRELLLQQPASITWALDDLHFADSASLQLLQAVLDGDALPQRWALAYRPAEAGSALQHLHEALLEHARLEAVALQPLDEAALAELVDSLALPGVQGSALAPGLLRHTGGNPLFVLETLKQAWVDQRLADLAQPDGSQRAWPRPGSVARLVERRLQQLSPAAIALARCAAVAGQSFSTALAMHVLGSSALGLADAWAELEQAQILRDQAFVHDLFHEAALASVPAAVGRQLHGEIAAFLEQQQADVAPAVLARHWLAAGQPQRAAPCLERAAQAASRALEPTESARLWTQLAELRQQAGGGPAAFEAAIFAVTALRSVTSGAALAAAIDRAEQHACHPDHQAQVHELRAAMYHSRGDATAAAEHIERGLATLRADAPLDGRLTLLNMQGVVLRQAGRLAEARAALDQALAIARGPVPVHAGLVPAVLNNLGLVLQEQDDHLPAIALLQESAERQTDPMVRARVVNNLASSLEERGQALLARDQRLAAARVVAGAGGVVEANLAISLGRNARVLGRYRDALQHLAHAQTLLADEPNRRGDELQAQLARTWIDLGRHGAAREAVERGLALAQGPAAQAAMQLVQARLMLALQQRSEALALLQQVRPALDASGGNATMRHLAGMLAQALPPAEALALLQPRLDSPAVQGNAASALPLLVRQAQALLALDRPAEALPLAQRCADWLQALWPMDMGPAEVHGTLARCLLACGDRPRALAAAEAANAWIQQTAREHIDAEYHHAWLQRHPVHAGLAALRAQLG